LITPAIDGSGTLHTINVVASGTARLGYQVTFVPLLRRLVGILRPEPSIVQPFLKLSICQNLSWVSLFGKDFIYYLLINCLR
jgi:hypothetical protein